MKRAITTAIVLGLLLSVMGPVKADLTRAKWDIAQLPTLPDDQTRALFGFESGGSLNDDHSWSYGAGEKNQYQSVLAPCSSFSKIDMNYTACIESVSYRKIGSTTWLTASLSKVQLGEPTTTIGKSDQLTVGKLEYDPVTLRPDGDKATFWSMPKAPHAGGNDYMLRALFWGWGEQLGYKEYRSDLLPISYPANSGTVTQDKVLEQQFPKDTEYKVRLRMGVFIKTLTGWFFGRLNSPTLDRNGPGGYLEITGAPAFVPIGITDVIDNAKAEQYFDPEWCNWYKEKKKNACGNANKLYGKAFIFDLQDGWGPESLSTWEKAPGGVKTVATLSYWSLHSYGDSTSGISDGSRCAAELYGANARVFQGAVFSNATLFQETAPSWDETNQSFVFKVAAPHLDEKGVLNKGSYTLYIPTEMAKCRWGDATSSARAEVQIVNSDGKTSVTTLAATTEDGNYRFNIAGFGYSSPTIKIRMGKDIKAPVAEVAPKKSIAIKCVKGKTVKKVVGVKPVCPSGYKKAAA